MSDYYSYFFCQNNSGHYGFKHLHNEEHRESDRFVCSTCEGSFIHNAENFHHFLLYWNEDSIGSKIDCGCWDDAFYAYTNRMEQIYQGRNKMSDLPDLVHQATLDTIERVRREEQERIIKLLAVFSHNFKELPMKQLIELIKGETNDN